jgi:hypothetical protein
MIPGGRSRTVEQGVARLLYLGTGGATVIVAAGCIAHAVAPCSAMAAALLWLGVAIFVLLPAASLLTMARLYLRQGRLVLGGAAGAVLLIMSAGSMVAVVATHKAHAPLAMNRAGVEISHQDMPN